MNKTSKELREQRKEVKDKIDSLTSKVKTEAREFTDAEAKELRDNLDLETKYNRDIELALELEKRAASAVVGTPLANTEEKEMRNFSISKLIREQSSGKLSGLEKELVEESAKEARDLGISANGIYLSNKVLEVSHKRAMVVGTAGSGGNFVPTEKLGFFDALYAQTVLAAAGATSLTGLSANADLTGFSAGVAAGWASETGTQTPADATTVARTLRPKLLYGATDISKMLLVQTNNSIENYILQSIMKSMAVAWEAAVINGDGSDKPTGILGTANIQDVAIGANGGAPTLAKILELVQKVQSANADTRNAKFLINPKTVAKLKQTSIDAGSGAMILAYNQYFGGIQNVIDGYEALVTSNVPSNLVKGTSGSVCSAIIYGDFSQVVTAQFGGVDLMIDSTSAAIARTGKVGITVNMFVDSAVKQPSALGAILDATTT
jgi:HK97 family phage major capsid protein